MYSIAKEIIGWVFIFCGFGGVVYLAGRLTFEGMFFLGFLMLTGAILARK